MRSLSLILFFLISTIAKGQELFVFTEPASNMPSHSISGKLTGYFVSKDNIYGEFKQRYKPEVMLGISKKFMLHVFTTMSNMHTTDFRFESISVYGKYRFFSNDDIHKHFRMAVYAQATRTRAPFQYDEISLTDKGGIELGIIATQLWNKLAVSGTVSHTQLLDASRHDAVYYTPPRNYQAMNYSLSAGYLLIPKEYTDYKQLNINIYTELLTQQALDHGKSYIDLAPALQFIFASSTKLNIGYRFELSSNMQRMANNSWQISIEKIFLNALKKKEHNKN